MVHLEFLIPLELKVLSCDTTVQCNPKGFDLNIVVVTVIYVRATREKDVLERIYSYDQHISCLKHFRYG